MTEKLNKPEPKRIRLVSVVDAGEEDATIAPVLPVVVDEESDGEFQPNDPARLDNLKPSGTIRP